MSQQSLHRDSTTMQRHQSFHSSQPKHIRHCNDAQPSTGKFTAQDSVTKFILRANKQKTVPNGNMQSTPTSHTPIGNEPNDDDDDDAMRDHTPTANDAYFQQSCFTRVCTQLSAGTEVQQDSHYVHQALASHTMLMYTSYTLHNHLANY